MTPLQKSIAEIEANRNEKIKEIAEFDGWVKRDIEFTHGRELYENDHHTQWLDSMPYLTDLNSLHRVALDLMEKIVGMEQLAIQSAMLCRPINGQYTALVDAVYDAIVYLKKQELCQPK